MRRQRRGLRKLPPELVAQAQEQTAATITRIMITFVGLVLFCVLSLLTPDAAFLTGGERLNVPFAGPVSFLGFMIIGPLVLIVLRIYLQIYVEHYRRLEPLRRLLPAPSVPTIAPLQNPLLRVFAALVLYLLLPLTMIAFTWKAAVLPLWGSGLLCLTVVIVAGHLSLLVRWPWRQRAFLAAQAGMLAAVAILYLEPLRRPAHLVRADLSNQHLVGSDLQGAMLELADLSGADLARASLTDAALADANLTDTNLAGANLAGANLAGANLTDTNLTGANLADTNLVGANLAGIHLVDADLTGANLPGADLPGANLAGAKLVGANLNGADLADANLADADLSGAELARANLKGANLAGADLSGADLAGASLQFADLARANLRRAILASADLLGANFANANIEGAYLGSAKNLFEAQLIQACADGITKLPPGVSPGINCVPGIRLKEDRP